VVSVRKGPAVALAIALVVLAAAGAVMHDRRTDMSAWSALRGSAAAGLLPTGALEVPPCDGSNEEGYLQGDVSFEGGLEAFVASSSGVLLGEGWHLAASSPDHVLFRREILGRRQELYATPKLSASASGDLLVTLTSMPRFCLW